MSDRYIIKSTYKKWRPGEREELRPLITLRTAREPWIADKERKCYVLRGRPLTVEEFNAIMADSAMLTTFNEILGDTRAPKATQFWTVEVVPGEKEERKAVAKKRAADVAEALGRAEVSDKA